MQYNFKRRDTGEIVTMIMTVAEMVKAGNTITLEDGVQADRDIPSEMAGTQAIPGTWPMTSRAAGVPKHQIGEAAADLARAGIPTDFKPNGEVVFRDRQHRSRVLNHIGMFDQQAGYGDRAPGQRVR